MRRFLIVVMSMCLATGALACDDSYTPPTPPAIKAPPL